MKIYGWAGLLVIALAEAGLATGNYFVERYMTPIAWTGYILFMDALVYKLKGESYLMNRRREFFWMLPWSVACWLLFEAYDLYMDNWVYVGTPDNTLIHWLGSAWAFATIFPGILLTYELIDYWGVFNRVRIKPWKLGRKMTNGYIIVGIIFVTMPFAFEREIAAYMYAFVWSGYVFLLEPINEMFGGVSILPELRKGKPGRLLNLFLAGVIAGLLWEFWNYWAYTKWVYQLPGFLGTGPKYFEMPIIGFLGFLPFAVEVYAMQNLLNIFLSRFKREEAPETALEEFA